MPWIEKYRPNTLDEVISQNQIVSTLKTFIKNKKLPHLLFHGPPGTGKCLGIDTPIIMYDGSIKKVQDITAGELLMGDNNTPRLVINTTNGSDQLFEISQNFGDKYIVNSSHILSLKLSKPFVVFHTNNIYNLYWFVDHKITHKTFNSITDLQTFKKTIKNNNIEGDICDISVTEYITKDDVWKSVYKGFKSSAITCWKHVDISISPYILGKYLQSANISIPKNYLINDWHVRYELFDGFIDGNGYVVNSKCKYYHDIIFLTHSLGYSIKIVGDNAIIIKKSNMLSDITVTSIGFDKYYGFEIDNNKRFLLGDFTVTHNTSVINACARELYGDEYDMMVIEINASEERGIEVVRNRITNFASKKSISLTDKQSDLFKLVILDEADAMTQDAQASLRRVIEKYTYNVRFCIICNYVKKINLAVQSRCICFRFAPLKEIYIRKKMFNVIEKENINITDSAIDTIIKRSKGDMRKILNILQSTSMAYKTIDSADVNNCLGYPTDAHISNLLTTIINKSFSDAYKLFKHYKNDLGYSVADIILEFHDILITSVMKPDKQLVRLSTNKIMKIIEYLRDTEHNIINSTNDDIHIGEIIGIFKIV